MNRCGGVLIAVLAVAATAGVGVAGAPATHDVRIDTAQVERYGIKVTPLAGVATMPTAATQPSGWRLAWSDEFDNEGLPDKTKWDYEEGFIRNEEMQYYTRARLENARVETGILIIEGRKERFKNAAYDPAVKNYRKSREFAEYTSASLITLGKASWTGGRIEVRAKLPQGLGVWPAIWTLGTNRAVVSHPKCGEIDIMEFVGHDPTHIFGTAHYATPDTGKLGSNGHWIVVQRPYDDFHMYAVEWTTDRIDFFFDGKQYHSFVVDKAGAGAENAFRKPHYLLLNLALGGSWGGRIDDRILPQRFLVDYVRVYERQFPVPVGGGGR